MDLAKFSGKIAQHSDGIWRVDSDTKINYPDHGNEDCYQLEDNSFWFNHRNKCIKAYLEKINKNHIVLDVGGGNGFQAKMIRDLGFDVILLEPGEEGCKNAHQNRGVQNVICSTLEDAEIVSESVDIVCLFDVVEHLPNDVVFMNEVSRILKPDGLVMITVPAYKWLWSIADVHASHIKRYNRKMIHDLLSKKFDIQFLTFIFKILLLPIFLFRALPYKFGKKKNQLVDSSKEHGSDNGLASTILSKSMEYEIKMISKHKTQSFGASCFVVGKNKVLIHA